MGAVKFGSEVHMSALLGKMCVFVLKRIKEWSGLEPLSIYIDFRQCS